MTARSRVAALLLAAAATIAPATSPDLHAQTVQLRPHAGLNLPTRFSLRNGTLHVRQKIGVIVGARMPTADKLQVRRLVEAAVPPVRVFEAKQVAANFEIHVPGLPAR